MIKKDKKYIYTLTFFYSALILLIVSLPLFFYVQTEKRNYLQNQTQNLEHYAYGVEKTIYNFSHTTKQIFDFPRSLFYNAYLFDKNGKKVFATNQLPYTFAGLNRSADGVLVKKIQLNPNRLHTKYLFILTPLSYKSIYERAIILLLILGMVIFFMTLVFVEISMRPLEKVNKYLNTFFNDAMHELKTPLGVMQLNIELLRKKEESKTLRRLFSSMQNMILIYEDIEYHIKHDYVQYRSESINISHFLLERVEIFEDLAKIKDITIVQNIEEDLYYNINRIELQRIIDNTLSNAIKYSYKSTTINVTLKEEEENSLELSIRNEGTLIKDLNKIFHRYKREDTIVGGFGIGLSIVKHICDKYSINIEVVSTKEQGNIFTYNFIP